MNKRKYLEILLISTLVARGVDSQSDSCTSDSTAGPDNPKSFNKDFDKDKGFGYVVYGDLYRIKCCGTIKKWEFSVGDDGKIELQVWRPTDKKNKKYTLVGLNKYSVSKKVKAKPGYVTYDVDSKDLLNVQENDVIGWYAPGDSLVEYTDNTDNDGIWKLKHDDKVKVGDSVDFSGGDKQSSRTYGIQATVAPNSSPEFDLLLATSISMNAEIGTNVYTVQAIDADAANVKDLKMEMLTQNEFFAFDPTTGVLSVSSEITVPEGGDSVTFDFKVTDSCGAEGTGSLTVHIDYADTRPTFPPRTDPNTVTDPETTTETTKKKTTSVDKTTKAKQTTKNTKTTKDAKTTKSKETPKAPVTTSVPSTESITVKQTTTPAVTVTEKDTSNETMTAMETDSPIDAALVGGIVAGIVGLVIIAVVTTVCIVNKKAKVRPTSKDPEKANNTTKENNAKDNSTKKQSSPDKTAPDSKPAMNGKPHVKDK